MKAEGEQELSRSELLALVAQLRAENEALKARIAELELALAKAQKNSSNSSKPPSSDIVKPPPQGGGSGHRHIGAHTDHAGQPFATAAGCVGGVSTPMV